MGERKTIEGFFREVDGQIKELEARLGPFQGEPFGEGVVNLKKMLDISRAMNSTLELDQLLNYVMDKVIEITRAERGFVILVGKEGSLDFKVARNLSREEITSAEFEISHSITGEVIKTSQPMLIENASEDGRFAQQVSVRDLELRSIMCVPLQAKGRLTGVVYVDNRSVVGQFDQDDLDLLILFASQAGIAIENARLYEDLNRSQEEIERWNRELERKVEEKTKEISASEEKYRTLVEKALAGIYIFQDERFKFVNPEIERISGYTREELQGKNFWEVVTPQDRELVKERGIRRERGEEVEGHYDFKLVRKDGELRDVEILATRIEYEGKPAVQGWVRDITEEKRAQEQIRRGYRQIRELTDIAGSILGERELKKVLDQIASAVKRFAGFKRVLISFMDEEYNSQLVSYAGITKREMNAAKKRRMTPEERKMLFGDRFKLGNSYYIPHNQRPFGKKGIPSRLPQGELCGWHPEDLLVIPLKGSYGKLIGFISVDDPDDGQMPTEEKLVPVELFAKLASVAIENARLFDRYEVKVNQLSTLLEVSRSLSLTLSFDEILSEIASDVKGLLGGDLSVLYVLDSEKILRPKAVIGKYAQEIIEHPLKTGIGSAGSVVKEGNAKILNDVPLASNARLPIKAKVEQSLLSVPLLSKGKMFGAFTLARFGKGRKFTQEELELCEIFASQAAGVIEDAQLFDEINQAYEKLKLTQQQLVQAGKLAAVGELAAGVAHELNNPIGGILGYAQYAMEKLNMATEITQEDLESFRKYLDYIQQGSQRCKAIVENLLRFSRANSSGFENLDINGVLEESITFTQHQLGLSRVEVIKDFNSGVPTLIGNPNQLEQVFTNLIINAGKAMPQGGKLLVKSDYDPKNSVVKIEFADTGCGIPQENLNKIFDPFFTTRKPGGGTGLGLSVSYGIVKNHQGKIEVDSREGEGTRFVISLPIQTGGENYG